MPFPSPPPCLLAVADVRHRIASRLVEGCDEWWQVPAAVVVLVVVVALVVWMYRQNYCQCQYYCVDNAQLVEHYTKEVVNCHE